MAMPISKRAFLTTLAGLVLTPAIGRAKEKTETEAEAPSNEATAIRFSTWQDDDPLYRFYPNDKIEVQIASAPELNRTAQVGQDGRITLPLIGQVMAALKSAPELSEEITELYRPHVRHPEALVYPTESANTRVLVGGEVRTPGWVESPGDFDALSAVMAAGGFTNGAKPKEVVLIRRGTEGQAMQRVINLKNPLKGKGGELVALRRYDIVYVPRTGVAEAGVWVEQHINNLIPAGIMNYLLYSQN